MKNIAALGIVTSFLALITVFIVSFTDKSCGCNEDVDCAPYRNRVLTDQDLMDGRTDVGFMEHGAFGSLETYMTLEKINPRDWDKNEYFTGNGWSKNKNDALRGTRCELINIRFTRRMERLSQRMIQLPDFIQGTI